LVDLLFIIKDYDLNYTQGTIKIKSIDGILAKNYNIVDDRERDGLIIT